jgi:hypothetical protein
MSMPFAAKFIGIGTAAHFLATNVVGVASFLTFDFHDDGPPQFSMLAALSEVLNHPLSFPLMGSELFKHLHGPVGMLVMVVNSALWAGAAYLIFATIKRLRAKEEHAELPPSPGSDAT